MFLSVRPILFHSCCYDLSLCSEDEENEDEDDDDDDDDYDDDDEDAEVRASSSRHSKRSRSPPEQTRCYLDKRSFRYLKN